MKNLHEEKYSQYDNSGNLKNITQHQLEETLLACRQEIDYLLRSQRPGNSSQLGTIYGGYDN